MIMSNLRINPEKITLFSDYDNHHFCLVTNEEIADKILVQEYGGFMSYKKYMINEDYSLERLLSTDIPRKACVVVISPYVFFQSPLRNYWGAED